MKLKRGDDVGESPKLKELMRSLFKQPTRKL